MPDTVPDTVPLSAYTALRADRDRWKRIAETMTPAEAAARENADANARWDTPSPTADEVWTVWGVNPMRTAATECEALAGPEAVRERAAALAEGGYDARVVYHARGVGSEHMGSVVIDPGLDGWADLSDAQMRGEL